MRENTVKAALQAGKTTFGSWVTIDSPISSEVSAMAGFDWLVVDMEHGPITPTQAGTLMQVIRTTPTIPLVRPLWNDNALIQQALDLGAFGIVVPMVNTRAEAEAVVRAAKYPPLGERSMGGMRHRVAFRTDAATHGRRANDETLVLIQIETTESLANLDDMLAVPGIDGVFVGPNDLSISMGLWPMSLDQPPASFETAMHQCLDIVARRHKVAGIMVTSAAQANAYARLGFRFISLSNDLAILESALRSAVSALVR